MTRSGWSTPPRSAPYGVAEKGQAHALRVGLEHGVPYRLEHEAVQLICAHSVIPPSYILTVLMEIHVPGAEGGGSRLASATMRCPARTHSSIDMQLSFPPLTSATTSIFRTTVEKTNRKRISARIVCIFSYFSIFSGVWCIPETRSGRGSGAQIDCTFHPILAPHSRQRERIRSSSLKKREGLGDSFFKEEGSRREEEER